MSTPFTVLDVPEELRARSYSKPIDGREFTPGGACNRLVLETIQTAMDFDLVVEYVGPEADGEVFEMLTVGTCIQFR